LYSKSDFFYILDFYVRDDFYVGYCFSRYRRNDAYA